MTVLDEHARYAASLEQAARTAGSSPVWFDGESLSIDHVHRVAAERAPVGEACLNYMAERVTRSHRALRRLVESGALIYGVNTNFGGLARRRLDGAEVTRIQANLLAAMKCGTGEELSESDVRAAMLARANALARGVSGVRLELIRRLIDFLNLGATPVVYRLGSIGASGDLVPAAYIAGAITGASNGFIVRAGGERMGCREFMQRNGLEPIALLEKEGLALINGTSVMTGVGINALIEAESLVKAALYCHAMFAQALLASDETYQAFAHQHKPHRGQQEVAAIMRSLLRGASLPLAGGRDGEDAPRLVQDRYSLRCLPQFVGPLVDTLRQCRDVLTVELNSATDNPLIDADRGQAIHNGNFLGEDVSIAMDRIRHALGLLAKHLDVQVACCVAPEFNMGLPASLAARGSEMNLGLKGLQLCGNSIMPLIQFYGTPVSDRFPTHAEQFNQNVNSLGTTSALLARTSVDLLRRYISVCLVFAVQAVELRSIQARGGVAELDDWMSDECLHMRGLVRKVLGCRNAVDRPLIGEDGEQELDVMLAALQAALMPEGEISAFLRRRRLLAWEIEA